MMRKNYAEAAMKKQQIVASNKPHIYDKMQSHIKTAKMVGYGLGAVAALTSPFWGGAALKYAGGQIAKHGATAAAIAVTSPAKAIYNMAGRPEVKDTGKMPGGLPAGVSW